MAKTKSSSRSKVQSKKGSFLNSRSQFLNLRALAVIAGVLVVGIVVVRFSSAASPQPGLAAQYFSNSTLSGTPVLNRVDSTINFNWASGSPAASLPVDGFSARWTGVLTPAATGVYQIYTGSDDGVRVWVGDQLVVNSWTVHPSMENSGSLKLTAGTQYPIKVEYYENKGLSEITLQWRGAGIARQVIPQSVLSTASSSPSPSPSPTTSVTPVPTPPTPTPSVTATPTPPPVSGAYPGQSGNPVGFAAYAPLGKTAWTGSGFTSGTAANPTVYKNYVFSGQQKITGSYMKFISCDFTNGANISGNNLTFTGDRFQSNTVEYYNVDTNGSNIVFSYDSFTPMTKFYTSPPGEVWPSAGAGKNTTQQTADVNAINGNEGYQFALLAGGGPITVDHADMWGFGNAIVYGNSTAQMIVSNSWIHDAADAGPQKYHTDGPGYLNGGAGPSNVTIDHNTIASLGNTNGIAFQAATSGYANMKINNNFFSGFGYTVAPGFPGTNHFTNSQFENNVFGTDIEPIWGALYSWTDNGNNIWKCNKYEFRAGTNWTNGNNWHPDSSYGGKYWLPGGGPSTTDYKGNTSCP